MTDAPATAAAARGVFDDSISNLTDEQFARVSSFIEETTGIRIPPHKRDLVRMRLVKRVRMLRLADVDEYVRYAFEHDETDGELACLVDAVTTNKTSFFREEDHFRFLLDNGIPGLLRRDPTLGRDHPLVAWSAGCASGEEAYTLAMVLAEYERWNGKLWRQVYASDICGDVLKRALRAVYPEAAVAPMPDDLRTRYLLRSKDRDAGQVRIAPGIRSAVTFARQNLVHDDPPFASHARAHVVFCRNVLIYFSRETQQRVLERIVRHMARGGWLFVGHAEMLHGLDLPLESVRPTAYRRL